MIVDILPFSGESRMITRSLKNKFKETNDERFNMCKDRKRAKGRCSIKLHEPLRENSRT